MADLSLLLEFYENMYKSRRFDERLWDAYTSGKPLGMTHLGIGEEAAARAPCGLSGPRISCAPTTAPTPTSSCGAATSNGCSLRHCSSPLACAKARLARPTLWTYQRTCTCWAALWSLLHGACGLCLSPQA